MQLIDQHGNEILISAGFRIFYQPDTKCIIFSSPNSRKLYFRSHEDKYFIELNNQNQFVRLAHLLAELNHLKIKPCFSPSGMYACEFENI